MNYYIQTSLIYKNERLVTNLKVVKFEDYPFQYFNISSINEVFMNYDLLQIISMYLYSLEDIIKYNRFDIFGYTKSHLLKDINTEILKLLEKCQNHEMIQYFYKYKFNQSNIKFPLEWFNYYILSKIIINKEDIGPFGNSNNWDILSLSEIVSNYDTINSNECWYDVAIRYAGMGHFYVLALLKKYNKCFFRIQGGANGWDRLTNMQRFIDHDPFSERDKLFSIEQGINILNNSEINQFLHEGDSTKVNFNSIV